MKPAVADYHYRCYCLRIVTTGGLLVRLTDYPRDLLMSGGQIYLTDSGYQFTGSQGTTTTSPGVMDLEGVLAVAGIDRDEVASGVFDGARLYCFATTWNAPVEDEEPVGAATLGRTTLIDERYKIEMMALIDALNQSVGETYAPACPKTFGGQEFAGCKVALGPITVTGTVTHVTSGSIWRDSARTEVADYFAMGSVTWTTGPNVGLKAQEIKRYEADGTAETYEPAYYGVTVGDEYEFIPGCRKRLEDCRDKWNNVPNFGGDSFVPTSSQYQQVGTK